MAKKKPISASVPVDAHVADTRPNIPARETAACPFLAEENTSMHRLTLSVLGGLIGTAGIAEAGMPSVQYTISESSKMHLENLSFFLGGFFLAAHGIMGLWNYLAQDFKILPRLSYGKALALVTLGVLLFILVLTMISGARELMMPGAWEKKRRHLQAGSTIGPSKD